MRWWGVAKERGLPGGLVVGLPQGSAHVSELPLCWRVRNPAKLCLLSAEPVQFKRT